MVVFALLCEPGLAEAPLREIAAAGSQASGVLVYAPELPRALIVEHRLRKAADDGDVEFRRLFWAFSGSQGLVAPSPLVYADLIASGDPRLAAAARELRETDGVLRRLDRS